MPLRVNVREGSLENDPQKVKDNDLAMRLRIMKLTNYFVNDAMLSRINVFGQSTTTALELLPDSKLVWFCF